MNTIDFPARHLVCTCLLIPVATFAIANDGDLDTGFAFDGRYTLSIGSGPGGTSDDRIQAMAVQADGKIIIVGSSLESAGSTSFRIVRVKADGQTDSAFASNGLLSVAFNRGGANNDVANAVAIQSDGKIVVAGTVDGTGTGSGIGLVRLLANGSFDTTFGADHNGKLFYSVDSTGNLATHVHDVALAPNGDILVAGDFVVTAPDSDFYVEKFDSVGHALVFNFANFDLGGSNDDIATAIAIRPDGKVVLGGYAAGVGGNADCAVARFKADLSGLDTTFGSSGRVSFGFDLAGTLADHCHAMKLEPNGTILIGGSAVHDANGGSYVALARLGANGGFDNSFSGDGKLATFFESSGLGSINVLRAIELQTDGKIVLAGYGTTTASNRAPFDFAAMRVLSNGALDSSFQGSTPGSNLATTMLDFNTDDDRAFAMDIQSGHVLFAGQAGFPSSAVSEFALARLTSDLIFSNGFELSSL